MGNQRSQASESQPHDVSVYVLQCKPPDNLPDFQEKYLVRSDSGPSQHSNDFLKPLTEIPRDALLPSKSTPRVFEYEVANADRTQRYPLFEELAARSRVVYYVGQTTSLCKRIRKHLRQNGASKFTDALEPIALKRVNSYSVGRSATTLCEQLRAEMIVASKSSPSPKQVQENYRGLISKIQNSSEVSISEFSRWIRQSDAEEESGIRFRPQIWWNYWNDVNEMGRKKEKEMALGLLDFVDNQTIREGETIDIEDLKQYAYWR